MSSMRPGERTRIPGQHSFRLLSGALSRLRSWALALGCCLVLIGAGLGAGPANAAGGSTNPLASPAAVSGPLWRTLQSHNPDIPCAGDQSISPASDWSDRCVAGVFTPPDLASLYNIPAAAQQDTNATVAILTGDYNPNTEGDMNAYRSFFGLPACTSDSGCYTNVDANGGTNLQSTGTGKTEVELDVEAVSAICPRCHIVVIQTGDDQKAIQTGYALGARYFSASFVSSTPLWPANFLDAYPDIVFAAGSGDVGFGTYSDQQGYRGSVNYPAADPHVVAVGGTTASLVNGQWVQYPWEGSGTGCATEVPRPAYQQDVSAVAVGCPDGGRATADISALAEGFLTKVSSPVDSSDLCRTVDSQCWMPMGGTSVATPIIAAMFALAGNHTNPHVMYDYARSYPSTLDDITHYQGGGTGGYGQDSITTCPEGSLCHVLPGWDGQTGVGAPNGLDALRAVVTAPAAGDVARTPYAVAAPAPYVSNGWRVSAGGAGCQNADGDGYEDFGDGSEPGFPDTPGVASTSVSGTVGTALSWTPVPSPLLGAAYRMAPSRVLGYDGDGNPVVAQTVLPAGVTYDPLSMRFSGTPTQAGTFVVPFEVNCSTGTHSVNLTLSVAASATSGGGTPPSSTTDPAGPPAPVAHTYSLGHAGALKVKGKAKAGRKVQARLGTLYAAGRVVSPSSIHVVWKVGKKTVKAGSSTSLKVKRSWRGKQVRFVVTLTYVGPDPYTRFYAWSGTSKAKRARV
jgi:hypothetical protein